MASEYPIDLLSTATREDVFCNNLTVKYIFALFRLSFNSDYEIRLAVYENLGKMVQLWISSNLIHLVIGIFIMSLGDEHIPWYFLIF